VPKREGGKIRELPITEGWNVLDDNLLACSLLHFNSVVAMLKKQHRPAEFTGGLEAARLTQAHVDTLVDLKPKQIFFAYDEPKDWEPLVSAVSSLIRVGIKASSHTMRAYVLIGYPGDSIGAAQLRLENTLKLGVFPMAMLYRSPKNEAPDYEWRQFQREWARPMLIATKVNHHNTIAAHYNKCVQNAQ
jgi:hypothetical protein